MPFQKSCVIRLLNLGEQDVTAALIVSLDPFGSREVLTQYVEELNAAEHRIPWLGNRRLRVTFADYDFR